MRNIRPSANFWMLIQVALMAHLTVANAGNTVPVMLWSDGLSNNLANPLHKTSKSEFENILAEQVLSKGQPPMIVFVKDNFCVEDIKRHKESLQQLYNADSLTYLTSVESPLSVFKNLSNYNVTMEDDLESIVEGQLAIVQITDLTTISDIYNMVRESNQNLMVALTGKSCAYSSLDRVKRAAEAKNDTKNFIVKDNQILFYADRSPFIKLNKKYVQLADTPTSAIVTTDAKSYNLTLTFPAIDIPNSPSKITLISIFNMTTSRYFTFLGMVYQPDGNPSKQVFLKSRTEISFPRNYSYHCSSASIFTFKNKTDKEEISVKIENMQVQMDAAKMKFGQSYSCIGFTSIPIWTGIFVTAILALIMLWGLTMIMDIRTMDRFDDPKGKTITISAQD